MCTEQLIQHNKVKLFGDTKTCDKILQSKKAVECKQHARNIKNYDHDKWISNARNLCEEGIKAKFLQNPTSGISFLKLEINIWWNAVLTSSGATVSISMMRNAMTTLAAHPRDYLEKYWKLFEVTSLIF